MKHILESIFTERNKMSQDRLAILSVISIIKKLLGVKNVDVLWNIRLSFKHQNAQ